MGGSISELEKKEARTREKGSNQRGFGAAVDKYVECRLRAASQYKIGNLGEKILPQSCFLSKEQVRNLEHKTLNFFLKLNCNLCCTSVNADGHCS